MTLDEYLRQLCATAGWPATPANLAVMARWAHLEGINNPQGLALQRGWNVWMTTWPDGPGTRRSAEDIGFGPGKWNNANPPLGVGMYATAQDGINATVRTIRADSRYAPVDKMFTRSQYVPGIRAAFVTWIGSVAYAEELDDFASLQYYVPTPIATPAPSVDVTVIKGIAQFVFDGLMGEVWLQMFEMAAGTRASTFGTAEQARLEAAVAALGSKTVQPHRHDMNLAVATTGPVTGVRA